MHPNALFMAMMQGGVLTPAWVFHGTHACPITYMRAGGPFGASQRDSNGGWKTSQVLA